MHTVCSINYAYVFYELTVVLLLGSRQYLSMRSIITSTLPPIAAMCMADKFPSAYIHMYICKYEQNAKYTYGRSQKKVT